MVTTRGCPYHCNWCAKPIWGQRYNSRSPENVAAEMKWLKGKFAPDHIWFADDILGLKPNWIEKFAARLNEVEAVIPFKCLQRADLVNEKIAAALAKAGCKTVWIGAESGSQKILDAMDKGDQIGYPCWFTGFWYNFWRSLSYIIRNWSYSGYEYTYCY